MQVLGILVGSSTRTLRVPERADLESVVAVLCVVAQTVWRLRRGALFAPRAPGSLTGRRSVQSDAEFVALESVLRAARQPLHSGVWPVRRLRSSINIATFPGRKARTVRRVNLIAPRGGQRADAAAVVADCRRRRSGALNRLLPPAEITLPLVVA